MGDEKWPSLVENYKINNDKITNKYVENYKMHEAVKDVEMLKFIFNK